MAYVHCMPARIVQMRHGIDNVVTGTIVTDDDEMPFRTRGHIIKATNKIYRGSSWKPGAGDRVLIDGEVKDSGVIVDHIEPDLHGQVDPGCASPHLDKIAGLLPKHPPATKTLRVWRSGRPYRMRFADLASRRDRRGTISEEVVHASHDPETLAWTMWTTALQGGAIVAKGLDAETTIILARAAGADLLTGETEKEKADRLERNEIEEAKAKREARLMAPPPFEDCPF